MELTKDEIAEIFQEHCAGLCRFLTSIVGVGGSAQEIAQESFLRLCQAELGGVSNKEIRFWLFRVARNLALNKVNREKNRKRLWNRVTEAFAVYTRGPAEELERSEAQRRVRRLLKRLPEHQRSALILREQEEMSYRDIALVLGILDSKVKVDIFRGRKKLRQMWHEDEK